MENAILQSVIEITGQRDLDSMDYSFVATLGELLPVAAISLLKPGDDEDPESLQEALHLDVEAGQGIAAHYVWADEPHKVSLDPQLKKCLAQGKAVSERSEDDGSERLLMPMIHNNRDCGVLDLRSRHSLKEYFTLIEGLVKIYCNYNVILYESERDNLTGLLNRRTFDNKLTRLLREQREREESAPEPPLVQRESQPSCPAWLAMVDIDHFKRVNDLYGHVYGDEILLLFARRMRQLFRAGDLLFRVGGEEFVVILAPVPPGEASKALERFRQAIEQYKFPQVDRITVSIGYEMIKASDYPLQVLDLADKALYFAKAHGRNCVHRYQALVKTGDLVEADQSGSIELF